MKFSNREQGLVVIKLHRVLTNFGKEFEKNWKMKNWKWSELNFSFFMKNKDFFLLFFWMVLRKIKLFWSILISFFSNFIGFLESSAVYGKKNHFSTNLLYHFLLFIAFLKTLFLKIGNIFYSCEKRKKIFSHIFITMSNFKRL